ncbi:hypothetical protein SRABI121_00386 [Microbacterium sp. Bi121]|nr:hypothetical protein SRABI121_00386 [Microbacterium sp. Bi121]
MLTNRSVGRTTSPTQSTRIAPGVLGRCVSLQHGRDAFATIALVFSWKSFSKIWAAKIGTAPSAVVVEGAGA